MTTDAARLDLADAAELGDLLTFLSDWLNGTDTPTLAASLHRFLGTTGYHLDALRRTLARFTFPLGNDDGHLFGHDKH